MASNVMVSKYTNMDRVLFESVSVDDLHITIGKVRIGLSNRTNIFNQVLEYFKRKGKERSFLSWLSDETGRDDGLVGDKDILAWECRINERKVASVYTEVMRIRHRVGYIEFYGLRLDGTIEYITDTRSNYISAIRSYLQVSSQYATKYCKDRGIDHCLEKSDSLIREEIKLSLLHNLIKEIDDIEVLGNLDISGDNLGKNGLYYMGIYNLGSESKGATPAWDSFVSSINGDDARGCFRAWVYSIFVGSNKGRQVLWLNGIGNTGKSVITEAISKQLPDYLVGNLPRAYDFDKFTLSSVEHKRLLKASDSVDRKLLRDSFIKNITGNDSVSIRKMGEGAVSGNVYSKVMITSNVYPFIDINKSEELSRILYITIDSKLAIRNREGWDIRVNGDWADCIRSECRDFIIQSKVYYDKYLSEDGHNISVYDGMFELLDDKCSGMKWAIGIWWDNCVKVEEGSNVMVMDLIDYFKCFCGKFYSAKRFNEYIFKKMILIFLRDRGYNIEKITNSDLYYIKDIKISMKKNKIKEVLANSISDDINLRR